MSLNGGLNMAQSYYVATGHETPPPLRLEGEVEADLCVVGGGCTGLAAALFAAERGLSVVLLEGGRIGWGASGRNGGQIIPGLRKGAAELVKLYGAERARALFNLSLEARDLVVDLIGHHGIDCDLKTTGHLSAAVSRGALEHMKAEAECLAETMRYPHATVLDADRTRAEVASPLYVGGLLDRRGGHLHPLNYTLGLAGLARAAGARLFEDSPAIGVSESGAVRVATASGAVRARFGVLACDALLGDLEPRIAGRIMPVANYIVATEPLAVDLIPHDLAVSDSKFVVNYFRLTRDRRLLFGGGERYRTDAPADIPGFVRPHLARVFPQLAGARVDYAWGGLVSVTTSRLPHLGRLGDVFFAHGYSGLGVVLSTLAGKLLVEAMLGVPDRFELFAKVAPRVFPGGTRLRGPLHVLGMLWYALRDRVG